MTHRDQIEALVGELDNVIDRFRAEFDLPAASVVGCLDILKASIIREVLEDGDDEEDDET